MIKIIGAMSKAFVLRAMRNGHAVAVEVCSFPDRAGKVEKKLSRHSGGGDMNDGCIDSGPANILYIKLSFSRYL